jgi:diaminopimelate decarboxylase
VSKNSKFGVIDNDFREVLGVLMHERRIRIVGLHCHLGSTIDDVTVYTKLFDLLERAVRNNSDLLGDVRIINVGGGLGINYHHDDNEVSTTPAMPTVADLSEALPRSSPFTIMVEPGRSLVGNAACLVTQVLGVKKTSERTFVVVDASMTELVRPALYRAYHTIVPVVQRTSGTVATVDFVGPVCESGDWLGKDRSVFLPEEGDLFAVMDAGAYCMAMASNYNLRARPAEVMVDGDQLTVIQMRETYEEVVHRQFMMLPKVPAARKSTRSSGEMGASSADETCSTDDEANTLPTASTHLISGGVEVR